MSEKIILAGLTQEKLGELFTDLPPFRSRQIYKWICAAAGFDEMTNIPLPLRKELEKNYTVLPGGVLSELRDSGTVKLALALEDGAAIEAVILRDADNRRKTACLSTQAGCPMQCVFCKTGSLGFGRNLTSAEIAGQFLRLKKTESDISHIVIMGMGEPLLNLDELKKAISFFTDPGGLNISKKRITVSTCGIERGILDIADNGPDIRLALSLTTGRRELREKLMPVTRHNPLPAVKEALLRYQKKSERRITLEIVLLGGINGTAEDAKAAAEFARGLDVMINLIPWNHVDGLEFEGRPLKTPSQTEISAFTRALENSGLKVTRRISKGRNISGACGQLGLLQNLQPGAR